MTIQMHVLTDDFRFLWLKRVGGFNPAVHCAKGLLGSYVKGLPFRGTKAGFSLDMEVDLDDAPYLYLCGVAGPYEKNLHLAMEPADGEEVRYEDGRIQVLVTGARLLPIDPLPDDVAAGLTKPFHTCRNYRFGWQYFGNPAVSAENPVVSAE